MTEIERTTSLSLSKALHVHGWQHLDAVLLAALATEFPLLLIGPHGTAKTLLVERLSQALGLEFRHYNASLINYDDLVGIPIPEEGHNELRFITTPGAIWDAQFVFFDEISRCRPDLQNKLFPIIHERRVVGMKLNNLQFRWAAMNPPSPDSPDLDMSSSELYLGSEPLDPALTDRFPFVIPVPSWQDLNRDDRRNVLAMHSSYSQNGVAHEFEQSLSSLVDQTQSRLDTIENDFGDGLVDYMIAVMDLLEKANLKQSPRRARMLAHSIVAVHAARQVLEGEEIELADSAELALLYGLPQTATDVPPSPASVVALHRQAWEIASMLDDEIWREILAEPDHLKRIIVADDLDVSDEDMSKLVTQALNVDASEARKISIATALFLRFKTYRQLTPAAWEPIANLAGRVLSPRVISVAMQENSPNANMWSEIKPWVLEQRKTEGLTQLVVNYVLGCFPDMWHQHDWQEAIQQFIADLELFSVEEFLA